jgi:hypothetical protein
MPEAWKRPCRICRQWFRPDPRVGERQRACQKPECQTARRQKTQASWRRRNPEYAAAYRLQQRSANDPPAEPLRMPAPLNQLPWDLAKDEFGSQGADFIGVLSGLLLRTAKDQLRSYITDPARVPGTLRASAEKTSPGFGHTEARTKGDATGVSPAGAAVGAPAGARAAPAATTDCLAG